jgi:myo-inositol-1(or 4)-monophosphatase
MTAAPSEADLLACAEAAARAAGRHALDNAHRRDSVAQRFAHDVKLHLDLECQRVAEQVIRNAYPGHRVLGEEDGTLEEDGGALWIVDPIDGTVNFQHGLPLWCSSVAVRWKGEVVAGAVYLPAMNECFTASRCGPACCNGEAIRVSDTARLEDALVLTGLSKRVRENRAGADLVREVAQRVQKVRILGAAAVDICYVACGRADGYFESSIYLWDVAAGGLIATRAGGRAEVIEQLSPVHCRYLCTNGRIHEPLKNAVLQHFTA